MNHKILTNCDVSEIEKRVFDSEGKLIPHDIEFWNSVNRNEQLFFMHKHGVYVMPTIELINWLKQNIIGAAIEIGAGNGATGRALNIPITDSKLQDEPDVKLSYTLMGQPTIQYPSDVEKLDAIQAIYKYKPKTVIGAFITHKWVDSKIQGNYWGVKEEKVLALTQRYINIGNKITHKDKPILKLQHQEYYFPWLITRSLDQSENIIFVFNKNN